MRTFTKLFVISAATVVIRAVAYKYLARMDAAEIRNLKAKYSTNKIWNNLEKGELRVPLPKPTPQQIQQANLGANYADVKAYGIHKHGWWKR